MSDPNEKKGEGGYVFVSHAHKDIQEIRKIRNTLEEQGLEPICFYLRCLSDDDEIQDLIEREIDAREWFLLVDSKNARESNWVKTELAYIKRKNKKKLITVSLDRKDEILPTLMRLAKSIRIFLSFSECDQSVAQAIYNECLKHDYKIFPTSNRTMDNVEQLVDSLKEASERGCVVVILSEKALKSNESKYIIRELDYAVIMQHAKVLPIIVGDMDLPLDYEFYLAGNQFYHLKTDFSPQQIAEIVAIIEQIAMNKLKDGK